MLREVGRLREASSSPSSSGGAALLWRVKAPFMCRFGLPDRFDFSASPCASAIEYCVLRVACLPFGPLRAPRSATTLRVASESAASASRVPEGCRLKFEYHRLRAVVPRSMPLSTELDVYPHCAQWIRQSASAGALLAVERVSCGER
jgi:hypothetical protein